MSDTRIIVEVVETYEATASQMRERFPDEWERFQRMNPNASDREWLKECLHAGPKIFSYTDTCTNISFRSA